MMELIMNLICAFIGTFAFSILFHVPKRFYAGCAFAGMSGWISYYLLSPLLSFELAAFFGTVVVVLLSRIFAIKKKCPMTVFLVAGIFPLVPGGNVYQMVYYITTNELGIAAQKGIVSLKVAFGIVLGIIFVLSFSDRWIRKIIE